MNKPIIGVLCCARMIDEDSDLHHVVFRSYIEFIKDTLGAVPILIPALSPGFMKGDIDQLVDIVDGFFLPGSPSNISLRRAKGIVNLDTYRPQVLLPSREQRTLAAWFKNTWRYRCFTQSWRDPCISFSRWCTAGSTGGRSLASFEEHRRCAGTHDVQTHAVDTTGCYLVATQKTGCQSVSGTSLNTMSP